MTRYRAYARDVNGQRTGELVDYGELIAQPRFNDVGGWHLTAPIPSRVASLMSKNGGIIITRDLEDGDGPSVVFSGPVTYYNPDGARLEVSGASDELLLSERAASPDPGATGEAGDTYTAEQDVRTGTASTIILEYIDVNAGPSAIARRRDPLLTIGADPGIGVTVTGLPRWNTLLPLLQELAEDGGQLRFQLLQSDISVGEVVATVTETVDRSATAVISAGRGTLGQWSRSVTRPAATWCYVLGQGQGASRQVIQGGDGDMAAEYGRYSELVLDARDTSDVDVLNQRLRVALAENGEATVVRYLALDTPSFRWGADYDLGDVVTVRTGDGETLTEIVRGVDLTLSAPASGRAAVVQPIVSTPGDSADDPATRARRSTGRRVSNLERNIDSLAAAVSVQWNVGDFRQTSRNAAASGWLSCNGQAVNRSAYNQLWLVIGTTYGAGDGFTTFNVPNFDDRVAIGRSATKLLGATGGAATYALANHNHPAGTLTGPSHGHAAGTLLGPSHQHAGPSHGHAAGTYAGPSHQHAPGTMAGPSHDHSGSSLSITGNTGGPSTTGTGGGIGATFADGSHTHGVGTLDVAGNTALGGTGAITGLTSLEGTGPVTGSSAADGTGLTGGAGTGSVTGITAADGTGAVGGSTGNGGAATIDTIPPYIAVHWEIYAGV